MTDGVSRGTATRRHLVLFVTLVAFLVGQPMVASRSPRLADISDLAFGLIIISVLYIVFETRRARGIALALFLPIVVTTLALYSVTASIRTSVAVALHGAVIVFLGHTVGTILRSLFRASVISGDDVLGAVCGYILGGMAWGNLFALVYLLRPDAFSVNATIAPLLQEVHLRHALFDYLSFTTLTSIGYADITPVGAPVFSIVWLEVMFGQFYMAVVVAQLVGLKLAQAAARDRHPHP